MGFIKGSFDRQRQEAAKILGDLDRFSASKGRVDEVARTLRNQGRAAAEQRAKTIYKDPTYGI